MTDPEAAAEELAIAGEYESAIEANLARNRLLDAGIPADVSGDVMDEINWNLTKAIGSVKVLVHADLAEEARRLLADPVTADEVEFAAQAEAPDNQPDEPEDEPTTREKNSVYAYRGGLLGLVCWPLQCYVFWLLLKVFVSDDRLRPAYRIKALVGALFCLPVIAVMCFAARYIVGYYAAELRE